METLFGYVKLLIAALLIVLATALVYLAEKKTAFGRWKPWCIQVTVGVFYGILAILATEYGIHIEGAMLNIRDAAPLCAGLIFGVPAGLIAGFIGGVERYFAVFWGAGEYTQMACTISTLLAGLFAGLLRKHLFDNKKPSWFYGLAAGLVMEVLHMLMIFVTNMNDTRGAFNFVRLCAAPMILFTGFAVMLSVLVVSFLGKEPIVPKKDQKKIAQAFQRWLLLCVVVAFLVTCIFTAALQTTLSFHDAERLLTLNIQDVCEDIKDASDENLLEITHRVADEVSDAGAVEDENALLVEIAKTYSIAEIVLIDENGIITSCTNENYIGYNMADGEQSAEFLVLLNGEEELVQAYQPISYDKSISRKYAGVALPDGGFIQVGYDAECFQKDIDTTVAGATRNRHVGESGSIIICDENWAIVSDRNGYEGRNIGMTGLLIDLETMPEGVSFSSNVYDEDSICMYGITEGYIIVATIPRGEAFFSRDVSVYVMAFMEIILFAVLFAMIYFLIKSLVVNNIVRINRSLAQITGGNLDVTVDVRSNEEFASLSDDINSTIVTLKRYIAEAAARIDQELEFARTIQHAALPSVFPPYPERKEFDLYAMMDPAKEVGGDFFDFYLLDDEHLAIMIADVSGKGIPAAMFMMKAKTLIKSLAESKLSVSDVMTRANEELCRGNDAGMFVTAWFGVLNIQTGLVTYANAGHNPPLIQHADGAFEYVRSKAGFVLAGMDGIRYKLNELELAAGDTIFLYTDGVTEATDAQNQLYGEDRLKTLLDAHADASMEMLTAFVRQDIDAFVGSAPQFDDITMLGMRYLGKADLQDMTFTPSIEQTQKVMAFVEQSLTEAGCPVKTVMKINIVMDELLANIVQYSGATETSVRCGVAGGTILIRISDNGVPYDPTLKEAPDTTLSAEERSIGGLGIFLVKELMDRVTYAYTDGRNVLTLEKQL